MEKTGRMATRAGREMKGVQDRRERAGGQSENGRDAGWISWLSHYFRLPLANIDGMGTGYMALSFQLDLELKRVWVDWTKGRGVDIPRSSGRLSLRVRDLCPAVCPPRSSGQARCKGSTPCLDGLPFLGAAYSPPLLSMPEGLVLKTQTKNIQEGPF